MTATRIDGKEFAEKVREEVAKGVKALKASHGAAPVGRQFGQRDPAGKCIRSQ